MFNGKGIYEVFSGQKEFVFGKQPDKIEGTDTVSQLYLSIAAANIFMFYAFSIYSILYFVWFQGRQRFSTFSILYI